MKCFIVLILFSVPWAEIRAQCFATPNNHIGGTVNVGIQTSKNLRLMGFYRRSESGKLMDGHSDFEDPNLKGAFYNYVGLLAGYGLTGKLNVELEGGYFIGKTLVFADQQLSASGFSNLVISWKYNLFHDPQKQREISLSAGIKIPFSRKMKFANGVELPVDIQPSTGSFGLVTQAFLIKENSLRALRYIWITRYELNFRNQAEYQFGNYLYNGLFLSKHLPLQGPGGSDPWTIILQVRNEIKGKSHFQNEILEDTGSISFIVSPQLNYTLGELWNLSILFDLPVYQYYFGPQLALSYSCSLMLTRDLYFGSMKWY